MGMEHGQKLREFLGWKFEDDVSGETFVVMDFLYIIIFFLAYGLFRCLCREVFLEDRLLSMNDFVPCEPITISYCFFGKSFFCTPLFSFIRNVGAVKFDAFIWIVWESEHIHQCWLSSLH